MPEIQVNVFVIEPNGKESSQSNVENQGSNRSRSQKREKGGFCTQKRLKEKEAAKLYGHLILLQEKQIPSQNDWCLPHRSLPPHAHLL